jgi:hypothetical protein
VATPGGSAAAVTATVTPGGTAAAPLAALDLLTLAPALVAGATTWTVTPPVASLDDTISSRPVKSRARAEFVLMINSGRFEY